MEGPTTSTSTNTTERPPRTRRAPNLDRRVRPITTDAAHHLATTFIDIDNSTSNHLTSHTYDQERERRGATKSTKIPLFLQTPLLAIAAAADVIRRPEPLRRGPP
jgi:hypothetical protein